ncbi:hypothetical protein [Roseateles sp.]|uniref:hypothetical protein n=1 Tax=Roseateles sp. TaxID=1971397 RepID=UPI0031D1EF46
MDKFSVRLGFWGAALAGVSLLGLCAAAAYWLTSAGGQDRWADFGTLFGGVAGPLISLLAFIAAAWAVTYQADQLTVLREQVRKQEEQTHHQDLLRTIEALAAALDASLRQPAPPSRYGFYPEGSSIGTALGCLGPRRVFGNGKNWLPVIDNMSEPEAIEANVKALRPASLAVVTDLNSVSWCLVRLLRAGGHPDVLDYYRARYVYLVRDLRTLSLHCRSEVEEFFSEVPSGSDEEEPW